MRTAFRQLEQEGDRKKVKKEDGNFKGKILFTYSNCIQRMQWKNSLSLVVVLIFRIHCFGKFSMLNIV